MIERRKFIATSFQSIGLASLGGFVWAGYGDSVKNSPLVLRPPGALDEKYFLSACIKCGLCSQACRNRETNKAKDGSARAQTIKMAKGGDKVLLGTPYFVPRDVPCYMCEDIPCADVCPSGALDIAKLQNDNKELDIKEASMGLAIVHKKSCIAFWGIQCDACYRACPLIDDAISLEYHKNDRTKKHAYLTPVVNDDSCTGCGLCEQACITDKPSIFVLPNTVAKGVAGNHYVKGWDEEDMKRVKDAKSHIYKTKKSSLDAQDYLNMKNDF